MMYKYNKHVWSLVIYRYMVYIYIYIFFYIANSRSQSARTGGATAAVVDPKTMEVKRFLNAPGVVGVRSARR